MHLLAWPWVCKLYTSCRSHSPQHLALCAVAGVNLTCRKDGPAAAAVGTRGGSGGGGAVFSTSASSSSSSSQSSSAACRCGAAAGPSAEDDTVLQKGEAQYPQQPHLNVHIVQLQPALVRTNPPLPRLSWLALISNNGSIMCCLHWALCILELQPALVHCPRLRCHEACVISPWDMRLHRLELCMMTNCNDRGDAPLHCRRG